MSVPYPKIAATQDVEQLRARLAALGVSLPIDDEILTAEAGSPLAAADRDRRLSRRQSLVHPSDGRLGRQP